MFVSIIGFAVADAKYTAHCRIYCCFIAVAFTMVDCCHFYIVVSVILYGGCSRLLQCLGLLCTCCYHCHRQQLIVAIFNSSKRRSCGSCSCLLATSCDAVLLLLAVALAIARWLIVIFFILESAILRGCCSCLHAISCHAVPLMLAVTVVIADVWLSLFFMFLCVFGFAVVVAVS